MILLNFSHALNEEHLGQIEVLTKQTVERVINIPVQFDHQRLFADQLNTMMSLIAMTAEEWRAPLLVNLPSLNYIATLLLAEMHGRMGHFPAVVRMRPVAGALPTRFEVAEILDLQTVRDTARENR